MIPGRWVFDYCSDCAANDEGTGPWDAGVGCPSDGPSDGCAAIWRWEEPLALAQEDGGE